MARRTIFIPSRSRNPNLQKESENFVINEEVEFTWSPGLAISQKQKSIKSLHEKAKQKLNLKNILEISSKSNEEHGKLSSAFNLKFSWKGKNSSVESFYQGSKIFKHGGPFTDLYEKNSKKAKKDKRIKDSGDLLGFSFFGEKWTLEDDFYTWIYLIGLTQNKKLSESLLPYEAFTDIEFNEKKSFNCQAYSAAFYVSLVKNKKMSLNKIQSPVDFKSIAPKKFIKNYQPQLL
jgi:hypothetical protein